MPDRQATPDGGTASRAAPEEKGRINQRRRTRAELLRAAARLMRQRGGAAPTIDDIAAEAMVSRATVYRYFPSVEALLVEAPLDGETPEPAALFTSDDSGDVATRLDRAESALHDMCYRNEAQLRRMLINSLAAAGGNGDAANDGASDDGDSAGTRQNRRTPLIEAALAPARNQMDEETYKRLCAALALVFGTESMIVFRDVVPLDPDEARQVKRWAIQALVQAALPRSPTSDR